MRRRKRCSLGRVVAPLLLLWAAVTALAVLVMICLTPYVVIFTILRELGYR